MKSPLAPTVRAPQSPTAAARPASPAPAAEPPRLEAPSPVPTGSGAPKAWAAALADPWIDDLQSGVSQPVAARMLHHALTSLLHKPTDRTVSGLDATAAGRQLRAKLVDFAAQLERYAELAEGSPEAASARVRAWLTQAPVGASFLLPSGWSTHAVAVTLRRQSQERWTLSLFNTGEGAETFHPAEIAAAGDKQRYYTGLAWREVPSDRLLRDGYLAPLLRGLVELSQQRSEEDMSKPELLYALVHTLCGTEPAPIEHTLQTPQRGGSCTVQCLYAALRGHLADAAQYKRVKTDLLAHLGGTPVVSVSWRGPTPAHVTHTVRTVARSNLARNLDKHLGRGSLPEALPALRQEALLDPAPLAACAAPLRAEPAPVVPSVTTEPAKPRPPWPLQRTLPLPARHALAYDPHAAHPAQEMERALQGLAAAAEERLRVQGDVQGAFALLQGGLQALPDLFALGDRSDKMGALDGLQDLPLHAWRVGLRLQQLCVECLQEGAAKSDGSGAVLALMRASLWLETLALRAVRAGLDGEAQDLLDGCRLVWPSFEQLQALPAAVDYPARMSQWVAERQRLTAGVMSPLCDYEAGLELSPKCPENVLLRQLLAPDTHGIVPTHVAALFDPHAPEATTPAAQAFLAVRRGMRDLHVHARYLRETREPPTLTVFEDRPRSLKISWREFSLAPLQASAAFTHPERRRAMTRRQHGENGAIAHAPPAEATLPMHALNRLQLLACARLDETHGLATLAHYQTRVRDLLEPDAQLELLAACCLRHSPYDRRPHRHHAAVEAMVSDLVERLVALAPDDVPSLMFAAKLCHHLGSQMPERADLPLQPALLAALNHALAALRDCVVQAPTPELRALSAFGLLANGAAEAPAAEAPTLTTWILAQVAAPPACARTAMRFQSALAQAQAAAHRAPAPLDEAAAQTAFSLLGWAWPQGAWTQAFPYARCGEIAINLTTGVVYHQGMPLGLGAPRLLREHPAYAELVGDQPRGLDGQALAWSNGVYASWDDSGVRFAKEFDLDGQSFAYEWRPANSMGQIPELLSCGHHVWCALDPGAPTAVLVTDTQLHPVAAQRPGAAGAAPEIVQLKTGHQLGPQPPQTPGLTPAQTLVWHCAARGPALVEMPRFGLSFVADSAGWRWREKPRYLAAAEQPRFFGRAQIPTIALSAADAPCTLCKVLVPRVSLATQSLSSHLEARTYGHASLADAPSAHAVVPSLMELGLVPSAASPAPALQSLRNTWSGAAAWRLIASNSVDAVHLAAYYTADKDYAAACACLRDCLPSPAEGGEQALLRAAEAFFPPKPAAPEFCDNTAHGHAVAAHVLHHLVVGLAGAPLPQAFAPLMRRYEAYLDTRQNLEPALQLALHEERAILACWPHDKRSPLLQQRATALGVAEQAPVGAPSQPTLAPEDLPTGYSRSYIFGRLREMHCRGDVGAPRPLTTAFAPETTSAGSMLRHAILTLAGASPEAVPERLRRLGIDEPAALLRERLAMARLGADEAATLRDLLCGLLEHPERLAQLSAALRDQAAKGLPKEWFADASLALRPLFAVPAAQFAPATPPPETRPQAAPLPTSPSVQAWTGAWQPPLLQGLEVGGAAVPLALPQLDWSPPSSDEAVVREQFFAVEAGLRGAQPQAFVLQGVPSSLDAAARAQLRRLLTRALGPSLAPREQALEAMANLRTGHSEARQRLRYAAGLDPRISLEAVIDAAAQDDMAALRLRNAGLTDAALSALRRQVVAYLVQATHQQHLVRTQALLDSTEPEEALRAKLAAALAAQRCFDPQRHPALLAFEYRNDLLLRPDQVTALHTLLQGVDSATDPGRILQLPMGAGKTKVLLPLLARYAAAPGRLPVLVVPPALLAVNHSDLTRTSGQTFAQACVRFDFSRAHGDDLGRLASLDATLAQTERQGGYVITTAAAIQSLTLAHQLALDASDEGRSEALRKLVARFAHQGVAFIDEADQALDVRSEVVFGVGEAQPLSQPAREAMAHLYSCLLEDPALSAWVDLRNDRQAELTLEVYAREVLPRLSAAYAEGTHGGILLQPFTRHLLVGAFLCDADMPQEMQARALALVPAAAQEALALGRLLLQSTLPRCLQRSSGQHYGLPQAGGAAHAAHAQVAIPYRQGQPKHASEFGCPYEAACYTLQNAAHQHTRVPAERIAAVLTPLQTQARQEADVNACPLEATEAAARWRALLAGTGCADVPVGAHLERGRVAARLAEEFDRDAVLRLRWVAAQSLPAITSAPQQAVSDAFDLTAAFRVQRGFTGTPWNRQTYAMECATSDDTWAVLRRGLLQNPETRSCVGASEAVDSVVRSAQAVSPRPAALRALLDVGAFYRHAAPQDVAQDFLRSVRAQPHVAATGVLFFGPGGGLQHLAHGSAAAVDVDGSTHAALRAQGIDMAQTLVYLDEAHCTGTDLPLPRDAVGIATVGAQTLARDLEQGIMRLRGLGAGQSALLCATAAAAAAAGGEDPRALYTLAQRNQALQLAQDKVHSVRRQLLGAAGRAALQRMLHMAPSPAMAEFTAHRALLLQDAVALPSQRLGATHTVDTEAALEAVAERARDRAVEATDRAAIDTLWPRLRQRVGALPSTTRLAAQEGQHVERQVHVAVEVELETLRQTSQWVRPEAGAPSAVQQALGLSSRANDRPGRPLRRAWGDARRALFDPDLFVSDDFARTHTDEGDAGIPRKRPLFLLAYMHAKARWPRFLALGLSLARQPQFVCLSQTEAADWLEHNNQFDSSVRAALYDMRGNRLLENNLPRHAAAQFEARLPDILGNCRALDFAVTGELVADRVWRDWVAKQPERAKLAEPASKWAR